MFKIIKGVSDLPKNGIYLAAKKSELNPKVNVFSFLKPTEQLDLRDVFVDFGDTKVALSRLFVEYDVACLQFITDDAGENITNRLNILVNTLSSVSGKLFYPNNIAIVTLNRSLVPGTKVQHKQYIVHLGKAGELSSVDMGCIEAAASKEIYEFCEKFPEFNKSNFSLEITHNPYPEIKLPEISPLLEHHCHPSDKSVYWVDLPMHRVVMETDFVRVNSMLTLGDKVLSGGEKIIKMSKTSGNFRESLIGKKVGEVGSYRVLQRLYKYNPEAVNVTLDNDSFINFGAPKQQRPAETGTEVFFVGKSEPMYVVNLDDPNNVELSPNHPLAHLQYIDCAVTVLEILGEDYQEPSEQ